MPLRELNIVISLHRCKQKCAFAPRNSFASFKDKTVTIHIQPIPPVVVQAIGLLARIKTIEDADNVFQLALKLIAELPEYELLAGQMFEAVDERRRELRTSKKHEAPQRSYFPTRPKSQKSRTKAARGKRCPARWDRKRRLGDMSAMPPHLRGRFTEGERAVLYIVAADCRQHGSCRISAKEIGDRAGVGQTTVRNALRRARQLKIVRVRHREQWRGKNLPNVVTIICPVWCNWLQKFRPRLGYNFQFKGINKPALSVTSGDKFIKGQPSDNRKDNALGGLQPLVSCESPPG
ncbi:hypothetical protein [Ensifer sp. SL37]|uniref:hypothetical protein n=1 Tax=Ensifer sp. SL37 TaxID=2995137 RepID=UPI0022741AFA|nr:hypothetical protein [Ensifer sp. SL37]MCY1740989.1 hypothetical protein [Ensifer sp. SL37]